MSNDNTIMTDGGEPVRKARFEAENSEAGGGLDVRGAFAVEKEDDADEDDAGEDDAGQVGKSADGLDLNGAFGESDHPDGRRGRAYSIGKMHEQGDRDDDSDTWTGKDLGAIYSRDDADEEVEKSVPSEARPLDLDSRGAFVTTEQRLLTEIRDSVAGHDKDVQDAVNKAVKDATEADGDPEVEVGEYGLADAFREMLSESAAIIEDAEELVEADAPDEEYSDLADRIEGLRDSMEDSPEPRTPEEVEAVRTLRERSATLADIAFDEEWASEDGGDDGDDRSDGDSDTEASGDGEADDGDDDTEADTEAGDD